MKTTEIGYNEIGENSMDDIIKQKIPDDTLIKNDIEYSLKIQELKQKINELTERLKKMNDLKNEVKTLKQKLRMVKLENRQLVSIVNEKESKKVIPKNERTIHDFTSQNFVEIFADKFRKKYNTGYHIRYQFDNKFMKNIMTSFHKNGKNNEDILDFISWAVNQRTHKNNTVMTIGYLSYMVNDYFNRGISLSPWNDGQDNSEHGFKTSIENGKESNEKNNLLGYEDFSHLSEDGV